MSNSQDAMLTGLKVLDCGENVSAPYAAKLMADLGADVIKVEAPLGGDPARGRGPYPRNHEGDRKQTGLFLALNTTSAASRSIWLIRKGAGNTLAQATQPSGHRFSKRPIRYPPRKPIARCSGISK